MRALDPEMVDILWRSFEPLLPIPPESHPLGCHRPRVSDWLCFHGILIRLVTWASWVDIEATLDHQVSDTTLRARTCRMDRRRRVRPARNRSTGRLRPDHRTRSLRGRSRRVAPPCPLWRRGHRPELHRPGVTRVERVCRGRRERPSARLGDCGSEPQRLDHVGPDTRSGEGQRAARQHRVLQLDRGYDANATVPPPSSPSSGQPLTNPSSHSHRFTHRGALTIAKHRRRWWDMRIGQRGC